MERYLNQTKNIINMYVIYLAQSGIHTLLNFNV